MINNNVKISIIIPAFNEEEFLCRCLDTMVMQTLQEIEIIIIDDGSTGKTPEICDYYATKHPDKIKVIHKKNEGQALARNYGIDLASGDYIGFVDADDWVEYDMFEIMYKKAIESGADIVICDVKKIFVDSGKEVVETSMEKSSNNINIGEYIRSGLNPAYAWNKIYKREIWTHYRFKKMVYEDLEIILVIESYCKQIAYVQEALINYYKHQNSTTTTYNNIRLLDIMTAYRNASYNANPIYREEIVFCVAKRILINMETVGLKVYMAEFIELINELSNLFIDNAFIKNDCNISKIYNYISFSTLPKRIFYPTFDKRTKIDESWDKYTKNISFIALDNKSCDIDKSNSIIRDLYKNKKYKSVGAYFVFKNIYEYGGIGISDNVILKKPIGELRSVRLFFCFQQTQVDKNIGKFVCGGQKGSITLSKILCAYEEVGDLSLEQCLSIITRTDDAKFLPFVEYFS
jgi:glycosyltransferase involved in cell wall biosynthesis